MFPVLCDPYIRTSRLSAKTSSQGRANPTVGPRVRAKNGTESRAHPRVHYFNNHCVVQWNGIRLANDLWKMRSNQPLPSSYGGILGCGLAMYKKDDKPNTGLNRLLRIVVSESVHLIWKLRCERRIAREDDPQKFQSEHEIHNRWVQAMNSRLMTDSLSTNIKKFGTKATKAKLVLQTWEGCLQGNLELPRNWCGRKGVLVGIAPVRRGRRR